MNAARALKKSGERRPLDSSQDDVCHLEISERDQTGRCHGRRY